MLQDIQNKPSVVYILSTGRSGSTLLEMLLNTDETYFTAGELQLLPIDLREDHFPCGCGERIADCSFWSGVAEDVDLFRADAKLDQFREAHKFGKTIRLAEIFRFVFGASSGAKARMAAYARLNADLYRWIAERAFGEAAADRGHIIDASKDPYRLLWMAHSDDINFKILLLRRSAYGFVNSATKEREYRGPLHRKFEVVRQALRWSFSNAFYAIIRQRLSKRFSVSTIVYEELVDDLDGTMDRIQREAQLEVKVKKGHFRGVESHAVAGNPTRWTDSPIKKDTKWTSALTRIDKSLIRILTNQSMSNLSTKR